MHDQQADELHTDICERCPKSIGTNAESASSADAKTLPAGDDLVRAVPAEIPRVVRVKSLAVRGLSGGFLGSEFRDQSLGL